MSFNYGHWISYPFEETVRFTFAVRIPGWCHQPVISINGQPRMETLNPSSFYRIEREWHPGDQVTLSLPFELALKRWPTGGISLEFAPLTLSLPVATPLQIETVDDWEQTPQEFRLSGPQETIPNFPIYPSIWITRHCACVSLPGG